MAFRIKNPFGQQAVDKSSPELMEREAPGDDGPAEVVQYNESDFERNVADRVGGGDVDGDGAADRVTVRGWDPEKKEEISVASGAASQPDEESIAIGDPGVNGNLAADGDGTLGPAEATNLNSLRSNIYRTSGDDEAGSDSGVTHEDDWESPLGRTAAHEAAHTVQQGTTQGASDIRSPRDADIDGDPADAQKNWLPSNFRREASDPTDDNTDADDLPNAAYDVKAPRDIATGQSSGREGGPRQTTSQDGTAVNEEGSSNIGSSAQENGTLDFQRDPNIGSSGRDGIAIKEQGVRVAEPNIGSSGQDGIAIDEEGPSTLLDLSAVSDGEGAVAIGDLDADGLPDMADFDTDYDADGIEADDLMVGP